MNNQQPGTRRWPVVSQCEIVYRLVETGSLSLDDLIQIVESDEIAFQLIAGELLLEEILPTTAARIMEHFATPAKIPVSCYVCMKQKRTIPAIELTNPQAWTIVCTYCQNRALWPDRFQAPCGKFIVPTAEPVFCEYDGYRILRPEECLKCSQYEICLNYAALKDWPGWKIKEVRENARKTRRRKNS